MDMNTHTALLKLDPRLNRLNGGGKELRDGLSAVALVEDTLWVACDETTRLERLTRAEECVYDSHEAFPLSGYLTLHAKEKEEADIEGLDAAGGYLWLVGSHSLKRSNLKSEKSVTENQERLATLTADGNRFLLARIPLVPNGNTYTLAKQADWGGERRIASQLQGDAKGSDLTAALQKDKHLRRFLRIPGKDNGFDIEGLCVAEERIFIGLRGPVLRGWTTILELAVREDHDNPSILRLKKIGPQAQPYRKHFLDLGGLGVRDICVSDTDLLILAGPTMDLDGPVNIFRWRNGAKRNEEIIVFANELEKVVNVPFGVGVDHAESMALLPPDGQGRRSVLVLYDAPSGDRKKGRDGEAIVRADIFPLT